MVDRNSQRVIRPFFYKPDTAKVLGNCRPKFRGWRVVLPTVVPLGVLQPVERKAVLDQPFREIDTGNGADGNGALISAVAINPTHSTGRRAMKASRSFAAFWPQR